MLTRLRFKNWRSLKDVTIDDLTPITVLIGGNSSGKTNIVDALKFVRDSHEIGLLRTVNDLDYTRVLRDMAANEKQSVELEISYRLGISSDEITNCLELRFDKRTVPFNYVDSIYEGTNLLDKSEGEQPLRDGHVDIYAVLPGDQALIRRARDVKNAVNAFVRQRWQILSDQFMPSLRLSRREGGDPYNLEPNARNMLLVFDFMQQVAPELANELVEKAELLLPHLRSISVDKFTEIDALELLVQENTGRNARTISTGTARILAVLTAIYALRLPPEDKRMADLLKETASGLIIIEEPDTSLSHWQYEMLVAMLRGFAEEWGIQFILTTHNPRFLDLFKLEEVRLVQRDDEGITTVAKLSEDIREIWLDEYGLGEVWTTNSFGDLVL